MRQTGFIFLFFSQIKKLKLTREKGFPGFGWLASVPEPTPMSPDPQPSWSVRREGSRHWDFRLYGN